MQDKKTYKWFPMRVTYSREMAVKNNLDRIGVENFVPMQYRYVQHKDGSRQMRLLPAVSNLIFVRSSQEIITDLKQHYKEFMCMRYIINNLDALRGGGILTVPDKQMENFIKVASVQDERIMFLGNQQLAAKIGKKVQITQGCFAGVEGVIKRIKNNKRVVVQIEGVTAVAIAFVPAEFLREIN